MENNNDINEINNDAKTVSKKPKKLSRFWKILFLAAGIGAAVIILLSAFFAVYIYSFERSQPEHVIKNFVNDFDHTSAAELIDKEYGDFSEGAFETRKNIIDTIEQHILSKESFFVKRAGEYADETPVYTVFFGDREIARVEFSPKKNDLFGFTVWSDPKVSLTADFSDLPSDIIEIVAPSDSSVTINGIELSDSYKKKTLKYEIGSDFEKSDALPEMSLYEIEGLYYTPEISVKTQESIECVLHSSDGKTMIYDYPEELRHSLVLVVPENASVTVNRQKVDESYIAEKDIAYSNLSKWNETFKSPPTRVRYEIPSLITEPDFTVTDASGLLISESQSIISENEHIYLYEYPDSEKQTVTIIAPENADIFINDVLLKDEDVSESGISYSNIPGINSYYYTPAEQKADKYIFNDLYAIPDIKVIASTGEELLPLKDADIYDYRLPESPELKEEYGKYVETFVENYITYYTEGNANTYYNFTNLVLPYILPASEASNYLWQAYYTLAWSPQSSVKNKTVNTYNYQEWSERCFSCYVDFDLEMNTYYDFETSVSGWQLFFVKNNNEWKISKMIYH